MKSGIYIIHNQITKKNYIGSAVDVNHRFSTHKQHLNQNKHHCVYLQRAWNKYGESNFKFIKIENIPNENLILREQKWLNSFERKFKYNICDVAGSTLGIKFKFRKPRSKEHCEKISIAAKQRLSDPKNHPMYGKKQSKLSKEKNRQKHLGKKSSDETKQKMSMIRLGIKRTNETKQNIANTLSQRWLITFPDSHKEEIFNLCQFCKTHKLSTGNFSTYGHTKGFKAEKILL